MTHTAIWENVIDGALCRLKGNVLEYQPRLDGDLLWDVTFRERYGFSDGWTSEVFWAASKEEAFRQAPQHGRPYRDDHVAPWFSQDPQGWTIEQITQAKVWAGDVLATRKIALKFRSAAAE